MMGPVLNMVQRIFASNRVKPKVHWSYRKRVFVVVGFQQS